jgi:phenylalanyl-tRNA synthetase beta chain
MKVSLKWLNQFVKVDDVSPETLADKLAFAGVEVEEIRRLAEGTNLVIGHVLSCVAHPDSDHLHVLKVDEGKKYGVHTIVCGAPNAKAGLNVIVAREGAVLPGETIKKSEIRGLTSDGMCCALYELGVDKKYLTEKQVNGIEELPIDAPIGEENVLAYLGLDDVVLDLKLLPNRSDLNAMENVAREVGAVLSRPVTIPKDPIPKAAKGDFAVGSETPRCPLFAVREVRGVKALPSPKWLVDILAAEGLRSLSSIVDIGNYVMLLTGQPLNLYDADKLPARELIVKDDYEGDFAAMDGKTYALKKGDLVVTSAGVPVCLAGILTGIAPAVTEDTKNVVVEAALFAGAPIRRTSIRLGLGSESSSRFIKGINPDQSERVLDLATQLLIDFSKAAKVLSAVPYDILSHERKTIPTSLTYLNGRLGTSFNLSEVKEALLRDHMAIVNEEGERFSVVVPNYRIDMSGEADVSEEVIRLLGFSAVKSVLPSVPLRIEGGYSPRQKDKLAVRRYLRGHGVDECLTYSLVDQSRRASYEYLVVGEDYEIKNPMTDDHQFLRKNLLRSLLDAASYNSAHQEKDLALYEVSDVDAPKVSGLHLAIVLVGNEAIEGRLETRPYDFYSAKGLFEGLAGLLGIAPTRYRLEPLQSAKEEFHPGRSAAVYLGRTLVAVLGELHPSALKNLGLSQSAVGMEIDLGALLDLRTGLAKASVPPRFPSVTRDLAFLIATKTDYEEARKEIAHLDATISEVEIFDLYEGANIAPGKKSMALTITFRDPEKTLKDEEVNAIMKRIIDDLGAHFQAEVRQ